MHREKIRQELTLNKGRFNFASLLYVGSGLKKCLDPKKTSLIRKAGHRFFVSQKSNTGTVMECKLARGKSG
jgi:hypothetical protein